MIISKISVLTIFLNLKYIVLITGKFSVTFDADFGQLG